MELRLVDPNTGVSVECLNPNEPWSMKEAVRELVNKIVTEQNIHPLQAMMGDASFQIVATENSNGK